MIKIESVLIADDHDIVRDSIAQILGGELGIEVATAKDKQSVMDAIERHGPYQIILLDIAMPGMAEVKSVEEIVQANASGSVVVFSGLVDEVFVRRAILNGARGFIPKTHPLRALASTLQLIASGQIFVPFVVSESPSFDVNPERISEAERKVLKLVIKGMSNKEIARQLESTEVRVKMYLRRVCAKFGAKNRTQVAIMAEHGGLLDTV